MKPFTSLVALTNTLTTDLYNPAALLYAIISHIRIVNRTSSPATFSMWLGATGANAAGTEVVGQNFTVAPNDVFDYYGEMRIDHTQFLVGGSSVNDALTASIEGQLSVA